MTHRKEVSNRKPAVGWAFAAAWLAAVAAMTWQSVRVGGYAWFNILGLAAFWLVGLGAAVFFFGKPMVTVTVDGKGVTIRNRWLWKAVNETLPLDRLSMPQLEEDRDSEGDPYYRCLLVTDDGRRFPARESHDREACEAVRSQIEEWVRLQEPQSASRRQP